jgi:hypothetical protein
MEKIETLHFQLHDTYLKIFSVYFSNKQSGFFAKLFGIKKRTINEHEKNAALTYYDDMEVVSKNLIDEINRLERRLIAMPEDKIRDLI